MNRLRRLTAAVVLAAAALTATATLDAAPVGAAKSKCDWSGVRGADYRRPYWVRKGKIIAYAASEDACPNYRFRA